MKIPGKMAKEVLRHSVKAPATHNYPYDKPDMPENFRGKIIFDTDKCIGCKICVKDCPAIAIKITTVGEKKFEAEFYLDRCIYCAQCVDSCPKDALMNTKEYELAEIDRKRHRVTFHAKSNENAEKKP
jgi:formate hydrogenlyase subunit 6/NADH:ubiquinone oxidoreductase subunit I